MNQLKRELIEFRVIKWMSVDETRPAKRSYEKQDNGERGTGTGVELFGLGEDLFKRRESCVDFSWRRVAAKGEADARALGIVEVEGPQDVGPEGGS